MAIRFNQIQHVWSDLITREDKDEGDTRLDFTLEDEIEDWTEDDDLDEMI